MNSQRKLEDFVISESTKSEDIKCNFSPFTATIPYDLLYQASRKEASRKKPVFFVHKYFARRITANFRLALIAHAIAKNEDVLKFFYHASDSIGKRNKITIMDPFMGGGTTIFEALRFGYNVIGNDLQPLSLFVTKALIEPINKDRVLSAVKQLKESVGNRIKSYYKTRCPHCGNVADSLYVFHVKKIKTQSPCGEHKLYSTFVIAFKNNEFTIVCPKCGEIHKTKFEDGVFKCNCGWVLQSPKDGYVKNGVFECPDCHEVNVLTDISKSSGYPFDTEIIAVEYYCPHCHSHDYKKPDNSDYDLYSRAKFDYFSLEKTLPIPKQKIPIGYNTNQILNHGYQEFCQLFNYRQLLCLGLLLKEINNFADKKTQFWLQLAFSGMLEMNNMFCRYQQNASKISNIFFNHAYVPITMPVENCVWGTKLGTGTFEKTIMKIIRGKQFNENIYDIASAKKSDGNYESLQVPNLDVVSVTATNEYALIDSHHPLLHCGDSRDLSFIPNNSVDLVLTDPPYGANVMYSELIDFFHVWNYYSSINSEIGFTEPLSPKLEEIIVNNTAGKGFEYYQAGLSAVFKECNAKLKDNGFLVFSFHDKSLDSWLAILESIFSTGYYLKTCFPVQSEARTGAHTSNKNSIGIDMMLICQKLTTGYYSDAYNTTEIIRTSIEKTWKWLDETINRLENVDAEITIPDVENITIGYYFSEISSKMPYNERTKKQIIEALSNLINDIDSNTRGFTLTNKRHGWWSELYKKKWNVSESDTI